MIYKTAIDIAKRKYYQEIVDLLSESINQPNQE